MPQADAATAGSDIAEVGKSERDTVRDRICKVRECTGAFNGVPIAYRAELREYFLKSDTTDRAASFIAVSYIQADPPSPRPVTFVYNGGPGSSSEWLHVGVLGPRRVDFPDTADGLAAPPFPLVDNVGSILDVTDLVFIDPIGTGYSRTLGDTKPEAYWGLREDAQSIADFIEVWIGEHGRWNAPKFIIGESYGTTRSCLAVEMLARRYITMNGLVWLSGISDYQIIRPRLHDGGLLSYVSFFPSLAATAWYHDKVDRRGRSFVDFLAEARSFASDVYCRALLLGDRLGDAERQSVAADVAAFTGLSLSFILQSNLRIQTSRVFKELLRDRGQVVGRLDSRFIAGDAEAQGEAAVFDPAIEFIGGAITASLNQHLSDLGLSLDRSYVVSSDKAFERWNWNLDDKTPNGGGYVNVMARLSRAMHQNRDLRILAGCGYFDLAAPFFGIENGFATSGIPTDRVAYSYYDVGHMIFLHHASRDKFVDDVRRFITDAC